MEPPEILFWVAAGATFFLFPERHLILNEIAIIGLFALSLDLILGYAGIVSLGHAAFFGWAPTWPAFSRSYLVADPIAGSQRLSVGGWPWLRHELPGVEGRRSDKADGDPWRGAAHGRNRQPRLLAHRRRGRIAGRHNGSLFGSFEFDIFGTTAYAYSLGVTFVLFVVAAASSIPFGLSLRSIRDNPLRARAIGIPVNHRLVAIYTLSAPMREWPALSSLRQLSSSPWTFWPSTARPTFCSFS